jgi:hypothetical protein
MANLAFKILQQSATATFSLNVGGTLYTWESMQSSGPWNYTLLPGSYYNTVVLSNLTIPSGTAVTMAVSGKYPGSAIMTLEFLGSSNYYIFTEDSTFITVAMASQLDVNNAASYATSKFTLGQIVPENAIASAYGRLEPLITAEQLRVRHLFGVPLVSRTKDPITGKPMIMTDEILKDVILRAVSLTEAEGGFDIFPVKYREKTAFDRNAFDSFGYMELKRRPVSSVDRLSVTPSNQVDVYVVPQEWVEASGFQRGQVNIVPLTIAFTNGGFIPSQSAGGAAFLSILGAKGWIPGYWQIEYTTGFPDGMLPRDLNELVGVVAAIEALSLLATTDADATSKSLSIDGLGQSVGGPGPQKYAARIELLMQKKQMLIDKFKSRFALKMFSSHV